MGAQIGVQVGRARSAICKRLSISFLAAWACILLAGSALLSAQVPAQARSEPSERESHFGTRMNLRGVPNFGKVTDTLYRGAQPTDEGFGNLSKLGINIVVDLRGSPAHERELVTRLGMKYVRLAWRCSHPQDEQFAEFLALLRENPGQKVFVHCRQGKDRTGMEIAAYRMAEQGWTADEARKEMAVFGANWWHRRMCPGLGSYAKQFPARLKTHPAFDGVRSNQGSRPSKP